MLKNTIFVHNSKYSIYETRLSTKPIDTDYMVLVHDMVRLSEQIARNIHNMGRTCMFCYQ
ncbi:hypothetical protein BOVA713_3548 [Bacteroides ovatus]|nr:hypothetical protein BOVA713_3548 [Bacteroides ovatus]